MTAATALRLGRPRATAERGRFALIAGSVAAAGALVLAAAHIVRLPVDPVAQDLAAYVTERGLRPGVVTTTLLLAVPVLALTVQALRLGSVARDRRMAALRLAGATPREARSIAAAEAGVAAAAGGLLAGPAFLLLWVVVGALPPDAAKLLDTPGGLDLVAWLAVVPLAALAGALSGAAIHGRAVVEPLGVQRRGRPSAPGRASFGVLLVGIALIAIALVAIPAAAGVWPLLLMLVGLLVSAFAGGPRFVLVAARRLAHRRGMDALLASRRLQADPRSPGRVAAVLFVCGVALAVEGALVVEQLATNGFRDDGRFYALGYALAGAVVLVAAGVSLLTLLVGAADGLLDARRPLAALAAQGVDEPLLVRALARQLSATAVPAAVAGTLLGAPAIALLYVGLDDAEATGLEALAGGAAGALVFGLVLAATARLAARLLRPLVRAAIDPENLRVA